MRDMIVLPDSDTRKVYRFAGFGEKARQSNSVETDDLVGFDFHRPDNAHLAVAVRSQQHFGLILVADPAQLADNVLEIGRAAVTVIGG
jgi:hypothetical protein